MFPPRSRRVKAFTILELLVALALSAGLLGSAYVALRLVQRQYQAAAQRLTRAAHVRTLQGLLLRDFRRATQIQARVERIRCQQAQGVVEYAWLDSCVVRQQGEVIDSFRVTLLDYHYFRETAPVTDQFGPIDAMELHVVTGSDTLYLDALLHDDAQHLLPPPSSFPITP